MASNGGLVFVTGAEGDIGQAEFLHVKSPAKLKASGGHRGVRGGDGFGRVLLMGGVESFKGAGGE